MTANAAKRDAEAALGRSPRVVNGTCVRWSGRSGRLSFSRCVGFGPILRYGTIGRVADIAAVAAATIGRCGRVRAR
jgi:hypothetical protein